MTRIASLGAAAAIAPAALAATPGEIAADLADGRVDGTYTQAELQAYLQSAMVQGYGEPTQPPPVTQPPPAGGSAPQGPTPPQVAGVQTPPAVGGSEAPPQVAGVQTPPAEALEETRQVGTLPFTGLDLALLAFGGGLLLLLGLGARRLGRHRP